MVNKAKIASSKTRTYNNIEYPSESAQKEQERIEANKYFY